MKSLLHFDGFSSGYFLCPICLKSYSANATNQDLISKAHIIPKAAGGKDLTYLCKRCNNYLGRKQDKWFGEFYRLSKGKKSILETTQKSGRFKIADIPVNGNWALDPDGTLKISIYNNRNSPKTLKALDQLQKSGAASEADIALDIPLLKNKDSLNVGFLTAAYLSWFRELGYSFALQPHLEPIRRQILNPEKRLLSSSMIAPIEGQFFGDPICAVTKIKGEYYLISLIGNACIFIPAVDSQNYGVPTIDCGRKLQYRRLRFFKRHAFDLPVALAFENRILVLPDQLYRNFRNGYIIFFEDFYSNPQKAFFHDEATIDEISRKENLKVSKFKYIVPITK